MWFGGWNYKPTEFGNSKDVLRIHGTLVQPKSHLPVIALEHAQVPVRPISHDRSPRYQPTRTLGTRAHFFFPPNTSTKAPHLYIYTTLICTPSRFCNPIATPHPMNGSVTCPHWQDNYLIQKTSKRSVQWLHAIDLFMGGVLLCSTPSDAKTSKLHTVSP